MEQKLKDKLDRAIAIYNKKAKEFNTDFARFFNEMLPKDIREMIRTIMDSTNRTYQYTLNGKSLYLDGTVGWAACRICKYNSDDRICVFDADIIDTPLRQYNDVTIDGLKRKTEMLTCNQRWFKILQDNACEIVADICQRYKELTEKQSDTLDSIFSMLDAKENPTKHVKVTVEWI